MKRLKVTCAVIEKEGLFLAVQRSTIMPLPLKWEFPGGKIEESESEENALVREIEEELSLKISLVARLNPVTHDYEDSQILLVPFLAKIESGHLTLLEHQSYKWLAHSELLTLDWADADLPVAREVHQKFS
ncbi:(deoxy)nucleoside triphosphate pyrophosphohydrolase [Pleomorphovibrio marinus]|uniref:(deoxy)nucleoside triphosphate pyrophosphohydrolase n=1 Tax=Pleomorphovibrio marinus TaxID=2164132 RepID=UPI000E0A9581|nr:(deoxy)nucleoside triphosphate pyrophosphohydrolase [Pleomorphovibrio marinus]